MDPREEQFWVQSGARTARNLAAWHGSGHRLKRAADLLRAQWKADLLELYRLRPGGTFPESVGGPMMLLAGFAIENLVKGLLIARDPSVVAGKADSPERLVHGVSARHLSVQLCGSAGVQLSAEEEDAVRRLEIFLLWAGRYPVPRDARRLGERHTTAEPQLASAASFSELELDVIDRLFERLAAELEREATQASMDEQEREKAALSERRAELLARLRGIEPVVVHGGQVFEVGDDSRDEPASAVGCAGGCRATFRLTPRTPAAICSCGTLHWGEPFYDGSLRRELLRVASYPSG
jgi:hypothetical protein